VAAQNYSVRQEAYSGACVVVAYIDHLLNKIFIANAGDSRAVLGVRSPVSSNQFVAVQLSTDHHGENEDEIKRIVSAHPREYDAIAYGRIKGFLQPTRGLGDGLYKVRALYDKSDRAYKPSEPFNPPYTTALPEVKIHPLTDNVEFLVLATDGLWDMFSSQQVIDHVGEFLQKHPEATNDNICTSLIMKVLDKCQCYNYAGLSPTTRRHIFDDTTITVILFKKNPQKQQNVLLERVEQLCS